MTPLELCFLGTSLPQGHIKSAFVYERPTTPERPGTTEITWVMGKAETIIELNANLKAKTPKVKFKAIPILHEIARRLGRPEATPLAEMKEAFAQKIDAIDDADQKDLFLQKYLSANSTLTAETAKNLYVTTMEVLKNQTGESFKSIVDGIEASATKNGDKELMPKLRNGELRKDTLDKFNKLTENSNLIAKTPNGPKDFKDLDKWVDAMMGSNSLGSSYLIQHFEELKKQKAETLSFTGGGASVYGIDGKTNYEEKVSALRYIQDGRNHNLSFAELEDGSPEAAKKAAKKPK